MKVWHLMEASMAVLLWLAAASAGRAQAQVQMLPVMELTIGIHRVEAEVAATQDHRMIGLMHRKAMPTQHGMLFVFPEVTQHCMWMRNTLIPLSVAFLDERGRILNVEDMTPQTEDNHCSSKPARYALEMNLGWFRSRGLGPGTPVAGVERVPSGR